MAKLIVVEMDKDEEKTFQKVYSLVSALTDNEPVVKYSQTLKEPITRLSGITFYPWQSRIAIGEKSVCLFPSEFKLLHLLAVYAGQPVGHKEICQTVTIKHQPQKRSSEMAAANCIMRLRKKIKVILETSGIYIETIKGIGYRLIPKEHT